MHPRVGWLVVGPGWEAWGVWPACESPSDHVSAVAAEGLIFFFFFPVGRPWNWTAWVRMVLPAPGWIGGGKLKPSLSGPENQGLAWTLESLVVLRTEREGRLNKLNLYLGSVCLCGQLPLGVSTHVIYAKGLVSVLETTISGQKANSTQVWKKARKKKKAFNLSSDSHTIEQNLSMVLSYNGFKAWKCAS